MRFNINNDYLMPHILILRLKSIKHFPGKTYVRKAFKKAYIQFKKLWNIEYRLDHKLSEFTLNKHVYPVSMEIQSKMISRKKADLE